MSLPADDTTPPLTGPTIFDEEIRAMNPPEKRSVQPFRNSSLAELKKLCELRGLRIQKIRSEKQVFAVLEKSHSQATVYEQFDWYDLISFIKRRQIKLSQKVRAQILAAERIVMRCDAARDDRHAPSDTTTTSRVQVTTESPLKKPTRVSHRLYEKTPFAPLPVVPFGTDLEDTDSPRKSRAKHVKAAAHAKRSTRKALIEALEAADRSTNIDFLAFPAEIRRMIYRLTCVASFTLSKAQQPAISKTNKLVRHESLAVFYAENRFGIQMGMTGWPFWNFNPWVHHIPDADLASIRHFEFFSLLCDDNVKIDIPMNDHQLVVQTQIRNDRVLPRNMPLPTFGPVSGQMPRFRFHHDSAFMLRQIDNDSVCLGKEIPAPVMHAAFADQLEAAIEDAFEDRNMHLITADHWGFDAAPWRANEPWRVLCEEWEDGNGLCKDSLRCLAMVVEDLEFTET